MSIVPSDSGSPTDPFAEFDGLSQQIIDRFFSRDSWTGHPLFPRSWDAFHGSFPFFGSPAVDRWETSDSHVVRFRLPEGVKAGEAKAQVDDEGFVTVTVPKRAAPERRRADVRVVEIEEVKKK